MMNGSACVGVLVLRSWSWPLRPLHERPPPPTPLSYSTTFTDPSGTQQSVSFTGTASGTSLTGTLTVSGAPRQVTATIGSDGSVSGKLLNSDGSQYGVFWGRPNGPHSMDGSFDENALTRW